MGHAGAGTHACARSSLALQEPRFAELAVLRREKFFESFALILVQQLPVARLTLLAAVSGNFAAAPALLPVCLGKSDTTASAESHWRVRVDGVRCLSPIRLILLDLPAWGADPSEAVPPSTYGQSRCFRRAADADKSQILSSRAAPRKPCSLSRRQDRLQHGYRELDTVVLDPTLASRSEVSRGRQRGGRSQMSGPRDSTLLVCREDLEWGPPEVLRPFQRVHSPTR